jgi:SAM-dependent methyltransferase
LDGKERAKLGAHYTPRAYVERLVMPTIMEPLRADWAGVQAAAGQLIEAGKAEEAHAVIEKFHSQLAQTKVLDPACGTGNFLYVALARMKELEGEVIGRLVELEPEGASQYVAELSGHTITPENFLGIEINPRAASIAQLVLWIGYLQWHFRVNGEGKVPPEPVLRDVKTIENRDALISWDKKILERDEHGKPLSRWDGTSTKPHPITGKDVPEETKRVEVEYYVNPKVTKWPKADFIVGNPPFIGSKRIRDRLGDGYFEALRKVFNNLPGDRDLVSYWWAKAAKLAGKKTIRRSGLITTNSLSQSAGQTMISSAFGNAEPVSIVFAVADHPWRDTETDAAVRVAMTVVAAGMLKGRRLEVLDDGQATISADQTGYINADLSVGVAAFAAAALKANQEMCFMGVKLAGDGFRVTASERTELETAGARLKLIPSLMAGSDITRRPQNRFVIDVFGYSEPKLKSEQPAIYQRLFNTVLPSRRELKRKAYRDHWWIFAEPRPAMRKAISGLSRVIVTSEVSKHATFVFANPADTQFDGSVIVFSTSDALHLGVLSSNVHVVWKLNVGGTLENRPRYQSYRCFDPFPFPASVPEPLKTRIRAEAEALDALRKQVLTAHDDLTLTGLYNVLEALKEGRALTYKERDIHDRGLVTLIRQHHDAIDSAVAEAYGWPADLTDEDILTRLVALNKQRAAEEAKGQIRWLRPEFQSPGAAAPQVNATLDLGDAPVVTPATIIPWPKTLAEQVSTVATLLAASQAPQHPNEIARAIKGTNAKGITPVLDALAAIGQARKLKDGRYAA